MQERIVLQHIVIPKNIEDEKTALYLKWTGKAPVFVGDMLQIPKGCRLSFFTYFNSFSIKKWCTYTDLTKYAIQVRMQGQAKIRIWNAYLPQETSATAEKALLCEEECIWEEDKYRSYEIDGAAMQGCVYVEVQAVQDCIWYGGEILAAGVSDIREINLAVGICTFRREDYVRNTLKSLSANFLDSSEDIAEHFHIFVSDNGNTLPIEELSGKGITIFPNKNAGGAGGFTRCMIEALQDESTKWTHILFMDDDIVLEPESVYRTYRLLGLAKEEYRNALVGGSLMRTDYVYIQHAKGELWDRDRAYYTKNGYDLRKEEMLLLNEEDVPINYNGWWYCTIPLENKENDLPLPIFVHIDDIEYGLRAKGEIITLNGIGVWHGSFEHRKASAMEYYDMRNNMIIIAIYNPEYTLKQAKKRVFRHMVYQLLKYRYDDQILTMRGIEDFLKGVDFLKEKDPLELHGEIQKRGYHMTDVSAQLKELNADYKLPGEEELYSRNHFTFQHILSLNGWLLPGNNKKQALPMGCHVHELYRVKNVMYYEPDSQKGFETRRKHRMLFVLLGRYLKIVRQLNRRYECVVKEYQTRYRELTNMEFWREYLELARKD